jgi:hypothetical protein
MSDTVTDTIACIGKNLQNNHKISIGIVICPIQSLLSVKHLPIHTMVLSGVKGTYLSLKMLKGTVA